MKAAELLAELKHRGRTTLHHACTLGSFRSYCALGAYRSRRAVTEASLPLTPQVSDEKDRELGVWNHLFLNIYDQHGDIHRGRSVTGINKYGPILMVLSADALAPYQGEIIGYSKEIASDAYRPAEHDVVTLRDFVKMTFADTRPGSTSGDAGRRPATPGPNMCVHCAEEGGGVPFTPHLREVIVDTLPAKFRALQNDVTREVTELVAGCAPHATVKLRDCIPDCYCRVGYPHMTEQEVRDFFYTTNMQVYNMPRSKLRS